MNLLLVSASEIQSDRRFKVDGRRAKHLTEILKVYPGHRIKAGVLGGKLGVAEVVEVKNNEVGLIADFTMEPPSALDIKIVLALPRPKVLRRTLKSLTELGVKEIVLINAAKVEKYYWQARQIQTDFIHKSLILGLEQSVDTILPQVQIEKLFRPFVEDRLNAFLGPTVGWVAHPAATQSLFDGKQSSAATLAIGPEGGWVDFELELLRAQGFKMGRFGKRILTVENAVAAILGSQIAAHPN